MKSKYKKCSSNDLSLHLAWHSFPPQISAPELLPLLSQKLRLQKSPTPALLGISGRTSSERSDLQLYRTRSFGYCCCSSRIPIPRTAAPRGPESRCASHSQTGWIPGLGRASPGPRPPSPRAGEDRPPLPHPHSGPGPGTSATGLGPTPRAHSAAPAPRQSVFSLPAPPRALSRSPRGR